ncbi:nephrin-like [Anopheles bellator]|uniref:nephrin-like n=1 Tax=Anopheles bellator TaxID=139047 RepID=UPI00264A130B|nr:nephrin-like [Anopheles bellator]
MTINRPACDVQQHPATVLAVAADVGNLQPEATSSGSSRGSYHHHFRGTGRRSWSTRFPLFLLLLLFAGTISAHPRNEKENFVKTTDVEAIEDHQAVLYCPLLASNRDKINMVLWFRDNAGIPLYSLDVRGKSLTDAQHWSAPQVFGPRARYVIESDPAYLELNEIKRHDQGIYRCRVDFQNSQTQSFRFNLTVIIPPSQPVILDRWGRVINSTIIGPKEEGDDILLTCRVVGGRPQPDVLWFINDNLVDNQIEQNTGNIIENRLLWTSVQRQQLHSVFTCQASNTKLMQPRTAKFELDMYLKPLAVKILNSTESLAAHREYQIVCQSTGARPNAIIQWTKGKKTLKRIREHTIRNTTVSVLTFVPTVEDDGRLLGCRAQNPKVPGLFLEHFQNISVHYPPLVNLQLGSTLAMDDIKEGDDIYFECKIQSNPTWRRLSWLHNGVQLPQNSSSTKIVRSNQSLVIQKVTRSSSGSYQCGALNSEGETLSNEIVLNIKYVPLCATDKIVSMGVSLDETITVSCDIITHPLASKFYWRFENSEEVLEIEPHRYSNNGSSSQLQYTPASEQDYGTLSCWGTNEIGTMAEPCIFHLIAAGLPTSVINCSWRNFTNGLDVSCHPGYDGGLKQSFVLEMVSTRHAGLSINFTGPEEPTFSIRSFDEIRQQLPAAVLVRAEPDSLKLYVYSVNLKGTSPRVFIADLPLPVAPTDRAAGSAGGDRKSPLLTPILIGLFLTIVLIIIVIIVRIYLKSKRLKQNINKEKRYTEESKNTLLLVDISKKDKPTKATKWMNNVGSSIKTKTKIETIDDEQDPDLIPYPRLTDIHQEELIPMNSGGSSFTIKHQQPAGQQLHPDQEPDKDRFYHPQQQQATSVPQQQPKAGGRSFVRDDEISEAEINLKGIEDFLMTNRVPESCV